MPTLLRPLILGPLLVLGAALWVGVFAPPSMGGSTLYVAGQGSSMAGTYASGDLIIQRTDRRPEVGDIVSYRPNASEVAVVHRIVGGDGARGFFLRGDGNEDFDRYRPTAQEIDGVSVLRVPYGGVALAAAREQMAVGGAVALLVLVLGPTSRWWRRKPEAPAAAPVAVFIPAQRRGTHDAVRVARR